MRAALGPLSELPPSVDSCHWPWTSEVRKVAQKQGDLQGVATRNGAELMEGNLRGLAYKVNKEKFKTQWILC